MQPRSLGRAADAAHVIDIEDGPVRLGLAAELAEAAGARLHALTDPRRDAEDGRMTEPRSPSPAGPPRRRRRRRAAQARATRAAPSRYAASAATGRS